MKVLGFSENMKVKQLKWKLDRCVQRLSDLGIVALPEDKPYEKHGVGRYSLALRRGPYFSTKRIDTLRLSPEESALVDPLRSIGLDDAAVRRVLREYPTAVVREWADITLAAHERHGDKFFKKSAAAFFIDNIQHAAAGKRSVPDWWRDLRRQEFDRQRAEEREQMQGVAEQMEEQTFRAYLEGEAREAFAQVMQQTVRDLMSRGQTREDAEEAGSYMVKLHFRNRFRREHPGFGQRGRDL